MVFSGIGDGYLKCQVDEKCQNVHVTDVLYVRQLRSNLLSVKRQQKKDSTLFLINNIVQ